MKLTRCAHNPILSPEPSHEWEARVVTNPGAWRDPETGEVYLLYRASGYDEELLTYFGLAKSIDGVHFQRTSSQPVFSPSLDGFDAGCVEDARVVRMGDWYYITYAARPFPPGKYWLPPTEREYSPPVCPDEFPAALRHNLTSTGLLLTRDFRNYIRAGRMTSAVNDDRDVVLFPEKFGGRFAMLHRPMNWVGPAYGTRDPAIWMSFSDDLLNWKQSRLLCKAEMEWEGGKVGVNTPPLRTSDGWLTLYHAVGKDGFYRLGALLLDLEDPSRIIGRSQTPLLEPEEPYETNGYYNGCVFPCGKVVIDGVLHVYYGAADKCVGLATCSLDDLLADLTRPALERSAFVGRGAVLG